MPETVVLDASALVEALVGTQLGIRVRARLSGCDMHAPAHLDAEVLSALGRLNRAGDIDAHAVTSALSELAVAPIVRHLLPDLLAGAWSARNQLRLLDALYIELGDRLHATVVSTDGRLARARAGVELVT